MKNSEKIRKYRQNFEVDSEIIRNCKNELANLEESITVHMSKTTKLLIALIALISFICVFNRNFYTVIGVVLIIIIPIVSIIHRQRLKSKAKQGDEYKNKKAEIIEKYNNLGYFPQIKERDFFFNDPHCGDYDEFKESYVCSVDGHFISNWNYHHRCNNSNQCVHCKKGLYALAPDGWYLEHAPITIDESISKYFYNI